MLLVNQPKTKQKQSCNWSGCNVDVLSRPIAVLGVTSYAVAPLGRRINQDRSAFGFDNRTLEGCGPRVQSGELNPDSGLVKRGLGSLANEYLPKLEGRRREPEGREAGQRSPVEMGSTLLLRCTRTLTVSSGRGAVRWRGALLPNLGLQFCHQLVKGFTAAHHFSSLVDGVDLMGEF